MNYTFKENQLDYETYYILRKSVKWNNWSREQAEIALVNSYYTVTVFDNKVPIGMGGAVGDGIYFMIMEVIYMQQWILLLSLNIKEWELEVQLYICFWNILRKICVLEVVLVYNLYLSQTKNSFI